MLGAHIPDRGTPAVASVAAQQTLIFHISTERGGGDCYEYFHLLNSRSG
jgi:hypothetical protein